MPLTIGRYLPILCLMSRRKKGTLLDLEVRILEIAGDLASKEDHLYGFALANALSTDEGKSLTSHGTLYKALARMTESGLLEAEWEDPDIAERERRPRRRLYRITADGKIALKTTRALAAAPARASTLRPAQA